jgi:hypothetical protein
MTTTAERPFDSFLIVGLTTTTSPPATLSSTFSAVNQPSSAENGATSKIIPENGFEFDSLGSSSSSVADVTSSILYHYPTGADADPSASSSSINPKSLCDFCFPDLGSFRSKKAGKKWKIKRETFSFVLTDTKGGKVSSPASLLPLPAQTQRTKRDHASCFVLSHRLRSFSM